ncbi:MAG: hypothetical protein ACRC1Z_04790 [Waterburya sp.]
MPTNELEAGLKQLRTDLDYGFWVQKYRHLLNQREYDGNYRILVTK